MIHPGFSQSRFRPQDWPLGAPLRRELGMAEGEILLGLVTSGDFVKRGVALFLKAVGGLREELRSKLHVLIVGREKDLEPYRRLAGEAGLGERARFLAPRPEVERIYHALDLMVHPALFEEFGQSVQEAMACGVPVVTSARVGAAELLAPDCEARRQLLNRLHRGGRPGRPGKDAWRSRLAAPHRRGRHPGLPGQFLGPEFPAHLGNLPVPVVLRPWRGGRVSGLRGVLRWTIRFFMGGVKLGFKALALGFCSWF